MKIRIEQIEAKSHGCSEARLSEYKKKIHNGIVEKPFYVRRVSDQPGSDQPGSDQPRYRLLDSFIRFQAAIACGLTEVECEVR